MSARGRDELRAGDYGVSRRDAMARFGGKKYGLDTQSKGPAYYGLTRERLLSAWDWYQRGVRPQRLIANLGLRGRRKLTLRRLVVEWRALGLPVWEMGRRNKIRQGTTRALARLKEKFDMPTTATMYAALKFAEVQGADLRAIVEADFGRAPLRARTWFQKGMRAVAEKNRLNERNDSDEGELQERQAG